MTALIDKRQGGLRWDSPGAGPRRPTTLRHRLYLTTSLPCIQGWKMQMKWSVVPDLAVTLKLTLLCGRPLGATRIESPGVLKPGAPTLTSGWGGGPVGGG